MNTTDREYSGDLARIVEAVAKIQGKPKMHKICADMGGGRTHWATAKHTPAKLEYKQVIMLDSRGLAFCLVREHHLTRVLIEWPANSRFWEFGTGSATIPTFQLTRILKRPAGVKDPRNTYVSFSAPENGKELRIREQDGEFRLVSFPELAWDFIPGWVFKMREFEGMNTATIQAAISKISEAVEV